MKTLKTVNVIECSENTIQQLFSFPDNEKGNTEAETYFKQICSEQEGPDGYGTRYSTEEIDDAITDGIMEDSNGWGVYLVHSS